MCWLVADTSSQNSSGGSPTLMGSQSATSGARRSLPTLRVVFTPDDQIIRRPPVVLSSGTTLVGRRPGRQGLLVNDKRASRVHFAIDVTDGTARIQDQGSVNGCYLNGVYVDEAVLQDGDVIRMGGSLFVVRWDNGPPDGEVDELKGCSVALRRLRFNTEMLADTDSTVIILGETGTGKEVVARALHEHGARRDGPFVAVNCAAIPEGIAERELFGHVEGAFTGATTDAKGLFAAADGGTLFLDELGDLPRTVQPKLLRVLEERRVTPVGSQKSIPIDVRILCATESLLSEDVAEKQFRAALYARLAEITLELPPLRQRREDILLLLGHFLGENHKPITPRLAEALLTHLWPHNVRELSKVAHELGLRSRDEEYLSLDMVRHRLDSIPSSSRNTTPPSTSEPPRDSGPPSRRSLVALLQRNGGNVTRVAKVTGRSRRQVYRWLEEHAVDPAEYRTDD